MRLWNLILRLEGSCIKMECEHTYYLALIMVPKALERNISSHELSRLLSAVTPTVKGLNIKVCMFQETK